MAIIQQVEFECGNCISATRYSTVAGKRLRPDKKSLRRVVRMLRADLRNQRVTRLMMFIVQSIAFKGMGGSLLRYPLQLAYPNVDLCEIDFHCTLSSKNYAFVISTMKR